MKMLKYKKKIMISVIAILVSGIAIISGYYGMGYNYAKRMKTTQRNKFVKFL